MAKWGAGRVELRSCDRLSAVRSRFQPTVTFIHTILPCCGPGVILQIGSCASVRNIKSFLFVSFFVLCVCAHSRACQDAARWLDTLRLLSVSASSSVSSPIAAVTSDDGCCAKATHNMRNKHVKERAKAMLNGLAMLTFWSLSLCNQASFSGSW